jgi:hypothetical protein
MSGLHTALLDPRLTLLSDGNPLRRLLLGFEEKLEETFVAHDSLSFQMLVPTTPNLENNEPLTIYP